MTATLTTETEAPTAGAQPRLTLRYLLREMVEKFFNLERGWLRTARQLLTRPGAMIRHYLEHDRKAYANPLSYLVLCTTLSLVAQKVTGFHERIVRQQTLDLPGDLPPELYGLLPKFMNLMLQNLFYLSFAVLIPFAILLRWFFRRSGLNLAESFVFAFFAGGQVALLGLVTLALGFLIDLNLYSGVALLVGLVYYSYAACGVYGRRLATIVKTCLAFLMAYAVFFFAVIVLTVVFFIVLGINAKKSSFAMEEPWTLVRAAEEDALNAARTLLEEGADVDRTLARTPLHVAAIKGHGEMVDLLMAHGADLNARDHQGRVPMFLALVHGHREIAWRLARAGTDATALTRDGTSLLLMAVRSKDFELARQLLEQGADVNAIRAASRRSTALMAAADLGELALVELLLKNGADPSLTNDDGETALDLAKGEAVADRLRSAAAPDPRPAGP